MCECIDVSVPLIQRLPITVFYSITLNVHKYKIRLDCRNARRYIAQIR